MDTYLHGECVAMGMLFFIEDKALKDRILRIYERLDLPKVPDYSIDQLMHYIAHDKKSNRDSVTVVKVQSPGSYSLENLSFDKIRCRLERGPYEE